ncbi:unnamed protein product [Vitrella brassicaformis CCMP3155]|uniref:Uncharacterized protein n=2 Tax=Vitrella brassicaformis TaxID=1169539 RepID=A0A0G4EWR8_VITBC|nr:unnamed protein product [Vitrella brassicaformis CCMP3155]|eukprot:CEM02514.1 unnamed protein product [Vitrella brassicaformis CCMP3155]
MEDIRDPAITELSKVVVEEAIGVAEAHLTGAATKNDDGSGEDEEWVQQEENGDWQDESSGEATGEEPVRTESAVEENEQRPEVQPELEEAQPPPAVGSNELPKGRASQHASVCEEATGRHEAEKHGGVSPDLLPERVDLSQQKLPAGQVPYPYDRFSTERPKSLKGDCYDARLRMVDKGELAIPKQELSASWHFVTFRDLEHDPPPLGHTEHDYEHQEEATDATPPPAADIREGETTRQKTRAGRSVSSRRLFRREMRPLSPSTLLHVRHYDARVLVHSPIHGLTEEPVSWIQRGPGYAQVNTPPHGAARSPTSLLQQPSSRGSGTVQLADYLPDFALLPPPRRPSYTTRSTFKSSTPSTTVLAAYHPMTPATARSDERKKRGSKRLDHDKAFNASSPRFRSQADSPLKVHWTQLPKIPSPTQFMNMPRDKSTPRDSPRATSVKRDTARRAHASPADESEDMTLALPQPSDEPIGYDDDDEEEDPLADMTVDKAGDFLDPPEPPPVAVVPPEEKDSDPVEPVEEEMPPFAVIQAAASIVAKDMELARRLLDEKRLKLSQEELDKYIESHKPQADETEDVTAPNGMIQKRATMGPAAMGHHVSRLKGMTQAKEPRGKMGIARTRTGVVSSDKSRKRHSAIEF